MIITQLLIAAIAVLATLIYASYLDIRDRRVPLRTWYPMLVVGIPAAAWFLYSQKGNIGLAIGFLSFAAVLLYTAYLDRWDAKEPFRYPYLAAVLLLPALAWFVIPMNLDFTLLPWYVMFAGIISYATYIDIKGKTAPLRKWFPILMMIVFAFASYHLTIRGIWDASAGYIALAAVFCGIFYLFATLNFFGGADAWALIFIALCIPAFPATPLFGESPLGFLPFSVLINAVILNLAAPVGIFLMNIVKGNRGPAAGLFFGFPVEGGRIREAWGFVMEDITEKNGVIERKFVSFGDAMRRMVEDKGRIYTKDLRERPEKYKKELALYEKAGKVWISYAVPFIVPITAGLITALVFGDILFTITRLIVGR
jgi:preflagellin peptidase FlaK